MEIWKQIPGFPSYEVSTLGNFRRADSKTSICVTVSKHNGYGYVHVSDGNRFKNVRAHILVLNTFVGERPPGQESRHLNGKRSDNKLSNLCWGTKFENHYDKVKHGTYRSAYTTMRDDHPNTKLTTDLVLKARQLSEGGMFQKDIASILGVSQSGVSRALAQATSRAEKRL